MKVKRILSLILFSLLMSMNGCFLYGTIGPQTDPMLEWFDVTAYMQDLFDMCYGDGYVNYVPGDPYYCPIYTKEEINAKLETIINDFGLTYYKILGNGRLVDFIPQLAVDYSALFTGTEAASRTGVVYFAQILAHDQDQREKLVFLPTYVPIGSDIKGFIYDFPSEFTFARFEELVHENEGSCEERTITAYQTNVNNEVFLTTEVIKVCIGDLILQDVSYSRDSSLFANEIHFQSFIESFKYDQGEWVLNQYPLSVFALKRTGRVEIIMCVGNNSNFDPQYDVIFEFPVDW
jgi:hypothetical protein